VKSKPNTEPPPAAMPPEAILLLDDEVTRRMVLTWPLLPPDIRTSRRHSDVCASWAALAACEPEQAAQRADALLGLNVVHRDGGVATTATAYLSRLASARVADLGGDPASVAAAWVARQPVERLRTWLMQHAPALFEE